MEQAAKSQPRTRLAVLHVDDSPADRHRRRRVLEIAGFRVLEAGTASDALAAIQGDAPDLALLDVRLPDTTGFELARAIKAGASAVSRDIGVILISTYFTESGYRVRGLESGADAYLIEPITDAELVASLNAVGRRVEQLKAARRNEELLDALFEYIPEGITVAEAPDVRVARMSRFGLALIGRSRGELEGISAANNPERSAIFRNDGVTPAPPEELPLTRAVTTGAVITNEEWVLRRPDGRTITLLCNAGPIRNGAGRITGGITAWRDITSRKEVEQALERRTEELKFADQAKNDFLATVVHELRQPITAALAAAGLLKVREDPPTAERAREVIERQLQQMSRIIEDLLDTTRVVRGQASLHIAPHDLAAIVRRSADTVAPQAAERGVRMSVAIPDAPVPIAADESRLEQVFVNLFSNAVRYTPDGGEVDIALHATAAEATIRIRDTGEGIVAERLAAIFDLFVRGATSRGLGVGLAVAKALVVAHGGSIEAHSEGSGRGSEFVVRLPL